MKGHKQNKKKRRQFKRKTDDQPNEYGPTAPAENQHSFWNTGLFGWVYEKLFGTTVDSPTQEEIQQGNTNKRSTGKQNNTKRSTAAKRKSVDGDTSNHVTEFEKQQNGIATHAKNISNGDQNSVHLNGSATANGTLNYDTINGEVGRGIHERNGVRHRVPKDSRIKGTIPDVIPRRDERQNTVNDRSSAAGSAQSRIPTLDTVAKKDDGSPQVSKHRVMNSAIYTAGNLRGFLRFLIKFVFVVGLVILIIENAIRGLVALCDEIEQQVYEDIANQTFGLLSVETIKNWPSWAGRDAIADIAYEGISDHFFNILSPETIRKIHEWIRS